MNKLRYFFFFFFVIISAGQASAQASGKWIKTVSDRKVKVKKLDKLIRETMDSLNVSGLSIAIINDGNLAYHRVFGLKDIESKRLVDSETIFEGASLSKPLFTYFFMKMVDKGIVSLDEPMYKLLPHPSIKDNDARYELITPRMVLSHSTGFPNWSENKPIEMSFTPGTGFSYSGEAHQYLTAYLAVANKTNWQGGLEEIFEKEVTSPLGMKHTYFVGNDYFKTHKATGYENSKPKELWLPKSFGAAHTMHSEAIDFAKFLQAMINGDGLSNNSYTEILKEQNHFKEDNDLLKSGQTGWALGFAMKPTPNGTRYQHTGNNTGFRSYCCFYKDKKYGLVFFTNSNKASELYDKIGKYLDDKF
jgi:CubicO group peptidase (beta-lactamase class C family)